MRPNQCTRHVSPFLLQEGMAPYIPSLPSPGPNKSPVRLHHPMPQMGKLRLGAWSKGRRGAPCPSPMPGSSLPGSLVGATGWAPFTIAMHLIPWALSPYKRSPMFHISGLGLLKYHEIFKPCLKETSAFLLENVYKQKIIIFKIAREGETLQF